MNQILMMAVNALGMLVVRNANPHRFPSYSPERLIKTSAWMTARCCCRPQIA